MQEILHDEQTTSEITHTAAAEQDTGDINANAVSLGKFKDAESLLAAYNSLQAEFTKRCQRLKELEKQAELFAKGSASENDSKKRITDLEKREILKDYVKSILSSKPQAIVLDGGGNAVSTPVRKAKSIAEAGRLAKELL